MISYSLFVERVGESLLHETEDSCLVDGLNYRNIYELIELNGSKLAPQGMNSTETCE